MPRIKVNDISMYYERHGQGEPIVFIAGFSADHLAWAAIVEYLKEKYQVILFDNRGIGQTDIPEGLYSID
nr:alpha/beta fold hydrolase [Legionella sainthelensi]